MSRAADSRMPNTPCSHRATLLAVTPTRSANAACVRPSRFRMRRTSEPFMSITMRIAYLLVKPNLVFCQPALEVGRGDPNVFAKPHGGQLTPADKLVDVGPGYAEYLGHLGHRQQGLGALALAGRVALLVVIRWGSHQPRR